MNEIRFQASAKLRSFYNDENGANLVEFTLTAVLSLLMLFGIMDFSRAIYIDHYLASAASDGARYAMVRGATWSNACSTVNGEECIASSTNVTNYVDSLATAGITASNLTVTTTWPGTNATGTGCSSSANNIQGCVVDVQVSYAFSFSLPFMPSSVWTMSSTAAATILQ